MEGLLGDVEKIGPPIRWVDKIIAAVLIITMIFGTVGNMISFIFFTTESVKSSNRLYFKRVYQIINIVDLLICISLLPVIDAFIDDPGYPYFYSDSPMLFGNNIFCTGWGLLWEVLPSYSALLVAILSTSRLIVLSFKRTKMVPAAVCIIMASYLLFTLGIKMYLLLTYDSMDYEPMTRYCLLVSHDDEQFTYHEIITLAIMITQLTLPIILVSIGFFLIMAILLRDRNKGQSSHRQKTQRRAAITVIIVTLIHIIFNIPVLVNFSFYIHSLVTAEGEIEFSEIYSNTFLFYYVWPLVYIVSVALNSALNPCVYFWRMKKYRTFIVGVVEDNYHSASRRTGNSRHSCAPSAVVASPREVSGTRLQVAGPAVSSIL